MAKIENKKTTQHTQTNKSTSANKPKAEKTPLRNRLITQAAKMAKRIEQLRSKFTVLPEGHSARTVTVCLSEAVSGMAHAIDELRKQPEDFSFKGFAKGGSKHRIEVGSLVNVKEKRRKSYDGMLEDSDLANLTVVKMQGNKVQVKTADGGAKLLFQRGHLELAKQMSDSNGAQPTA